MCVGGFCGLLRFGKRRIGWGLLVMFFAGLRWLLVLISIIIKTLCTSAEQDERTQQLDQYHKSHRLSNQSPLYAPLDIVN